MKSLLIVGYGGYGQVVKEIAAMQGYDRIDFIDDNNPQAVGTTKQIEQLEAQYDGSIVAIGNPELRNLFFERLKNPVTLIHPSAVISDSASIGAGCVIEAGAVVNTSSVVKSGCFICAGAVVNHNAVVSEFCQVDCNAVVCAGAEVPAETKVESSTSFTKIVISDE